MPEESVENHRVELARQRVEELEEWMSHVAAIQKPSNAVLIEMEVTVSYDDGHRCQVTVRGEKEDV